MARYQYAGPGPDESSGEIIRPGDVREFDTEPAWGPWVLLDGPEEEPEAEEEPGTGQQSGTGEEPAQAAADGGQPIVTPVSLAAPKEF